MAQDIIWKADCYSARQKISRFLTEPEGSSPRSQKPATGPYPEPAESSSPLGLEVAKNKAKNPIASECLE
jgi:hypothetical protein